MSKYDDSLQANLFYMLTLFLNLIRIEGLGLFLGKLYISVDPMWRMQSVKPLWSTFIETSDFEN